MTPSANVGTGVSAITVGSRTTASISYVSSRAANLRLGTPTKQDEFVYIIEGEFVLVTDAGRETVGPGTCIAFPAGTDDGHHFLNATDNDAH